jgi:hypothetical protein
MSDPTQQLWNVKITFTDGVYFCDAWAVDADRALHLCLTDARMVSGHPSLIGDVREVSIIWKGKM